MSNGSRDAFNYPHIEYLAGRGYIYSGNEVYWDPFETKTQYYQFNEWEQKKTTKAKRERFSEGSL